jgi:precorrin-6B C5,15-methyltransferase / cobalt-precorrin-6B C5,C15-methyltransferase
MKTAAKSDPNEWRPPIVLLVGLGLGREDLSARACRWLERAEVLVGGKRHLESFPEFQGEKISLEAPLEESLQRLKDHSERKRTAVLASGDPFFFGIGRRLARYLGKERLLTFPNATSVQALFAALGEAWEDVAVLSLHGGVRLAQPAEWLRAVRSTTRVALLTDPYRTPGWIAQQLIEAGLVDRTLIVGEDLGLPTECIHHLSLEEARNRSFSPLNMVVVSREDGGKNHISASSDLPVFGLSESAFEHEAGMITKMEVRAVALAQLHLKPGLILWDLGAASGSVSIEAARLTALREVLAVEKNAGRFEALQRNIKAFGLAEVRAVHGRAHDMLDQLPDPDRVFIGGSGEDLPEILRGVRARLRPGGRVVQTVVTLDTLETARSFWSGQPFEMSIIQLQVNRAAAIAESLRFEALNPVFILSVWPK